MTLTRIGVLVCIWGLGFGCSDPDARLAGDLSDVEAVDESSTARTLVETIRERHRVLVEPADGNDSSAVRAELSAVLPEASVKTFRREGGMLRPEFEQATRAKVLLPAGAAGPVRVEAAGSGLAVEATLRGTKDVAAEVADGYVVYPGALSSGGDVIHRVSGDGTEDYLTFEQRPAEPRVSYTIALSREVFGLRLIANTLEFVDRQGNPKLRVNAPYLIGADGQRVDAELSVSGCRVDTNPAEPWGRATVDPGERECELTVSWDDSHLTYPAILDPAWTSTANMAAARTNHTATLFPTGAESRVLVTGGFSGSSMRSSAELYNPTTRTWASTGSMTNSRMDHTATMTFQNGATRILVAGGGRNGQGPVACELYNPTTGTFSAAASLPSQRWRHTATSVGTALVMIAGGNTGSGVHSNSRVYDANTNTWSAGSTMVVGQEQHTATSTLISGQTGVLVVGVNSPSAQFYNSTTRVWSALAKQPAVPRRQHAAIITPGGAGGRILIAGGVDAAGTTLGSAEAFSAPDGTWLRTGSMRYPRTFNSLSEMASFEFVVAGGNATFGGNTSEIWNVGYGTWEPGPNLVTGRFSHTATKLNNGKVLVTGGTLPGTSTVTATAEEFDPAAGSIPITRLEYKFPAVDDDVVLVDDPRKIELWASMHRPATLAAGVRYPLILMLHGNHHSCGRIGTSPRIDDNSQYTEDGTCPAGYSVVNNHAGYDYIAGELAARNYFVVSINANRGIALRNNGPSDDINLIMARGRLVLRHLELISKWNRGVQTPPAGFGSLTGKIDMRQIGLMGHSRGGHAMRAAYEQYRDSGSIWPGLINDSVTFKGILEIAPTDTGVSRILGSSGTKWGVILPMCDGDVNSLRGVRVFDRMIGLTTESTAGFKATYTVWGANHNFFNMEWQRPDSSGCFGHRPIFTNNEGVIVGTGSEEQRQTGFLAALSFFGANVGLNADTTLNQLFDPSFRGPTDRVDRGYHPGQSVTLRKQLENFTLATGRNMHDFPNDASNVTVEHGSIPEHDPDHRGATISWTTAGNSRFFQMNFPINGFGFDLRPFQTLDIRVDRARDATLNTATTTDFEVSLVNSTGTRTSSQRISTFLRLEGPVGITQTSTHSMLQTARIPLSGFNNADLLNIIGVRLTFNVTTSGKIYVANVQATKATTTASSLVLASAPTAPGTALVTASSASPALPSLLGAPPILPQRITVGNAISALRTKDASSVEIELRTTTKFDGRDAAPVLSIGDETSRVSFHPNGAADGIVFVVSREAFDRLQGGESVSVHYGDDDPSSTVWTFGRFDKSRLDR